MFLAFGGSVLQVLHSIMLYHYIILKGHSI